MTGAPRYLLCFGLGYSARVLAGRLAGEGWRITGTSRAAGSEAQRFERDHPLPTEAFAGVSHVLISIPPDELGDPVLNIHADDIAVVCELDRRPLAGMP